MITFGRYEILERLGAGGMAEVFRARAYGADGFVKDLVVKKILPTHSANTDFRKMFIDEAKITVGLAHTNIVQVFDFGKVDDSYFIAMEQVHGTDLRKLLKTMEEKGASMPTSVALFIVSEVLKGLDYAHRRTAPDGHPLGIVHRDVSPANVLLSYEGEVKVADFGIARAATRAELFEGQVVGKPRYMSPEQIQDLPVDGRSDVFACGIVMHELLTGEQPFFGGDEGDTFAMILEGKMSGGKELTAHLPADLRPLVLKALAVKPDDRWPSAAAFSEAIQDYALDHRLKLGPAMLADFLKLCGFVPGRASDPDAGTQRTKEVTVLARVGIGSEFKQVAEINPPLEDGSLAASSSGRQPAKPAEPLPARSGSRRLAALTGLVALAAVAGGAAIGLPKLFPAATPLPPTPTPIAVVTTAPPAATPPPTVAATATPTRVAIATPRKTHALPTPTAVVVATPPADPGLLRLNSLPVGEVFVDGKDTGQSTPIVMAPLSLSPGAHQVKIVGKDAAGATISATIPVTIESGKTTTRGGIELH